MRDRFRIRVWNKQEKRMIYNAECAYDGQNYNINLLGENNNDLHICCLAEYLDSKDYIPMGCVGLKDMNKQLIYESDYIKYNDFIWKVVYGDGCHDTGWKLRKVDSYYVHIIELNTLGYSKVNDMEVIGNIYETKLKDLQ